jgi:hypothetical protein
VILELALRGLELLDLARRVENLEAHIRVSANRRTS